MNFPNISEMIRNFTRVSGGHCFHYKLYNRILQEFQEDIVSIINYLIEFTRK